VKIGDLVKRTNGRRTHWVGYVIGVDVSFMSHVDGTGSEIKKFLVRWFGGPDKVEDMWEADFSLEVVV